MLPFETAPKRGTIQKSPVLSIGGYFPVERRLCRENREVLTLAQMPAFKGFDAFFASNADAQSAMLAVPLFFQVEHCDMSKWGFDLRIQATLSAPSI